MMEDMPQLIKVELIAKPSINTAVGVGVGVAMISMDEPCWMDSIIDFLAEDRVLDNEKEANKVHRVATQYWLSADHKLYQRSFRGLHLLCLHLKRVNELLAKLYDGVCGSYVGERSLAHQAMTQGFWWPQMQKDAAEYMRKCEQYQKHAPLIHQPTGHLNLVSNPWPFT